MNKHYWYFLNTTTGESGEAIEPITFKRFIKECCLQEQPITTLHIARKKETVLSKLEVV